MRDYSKTTRNATSILKQGGRNRGSGVVQGVRGSTKKGGLFCRPCVDSVQSFQVCLRSIPITPPPSNSVNSANSSNVSDRASRRLRAAECRPYAPLPQGGRRKAGGSRTVVSTGSYFVRVVLEIVQSPNCEESEACDKSGGHQAASRCASSTVA